MEVLLLLIAPLFVLTVPSSEETEVYENDLHSAYWFSLYSMAFAFFWYLHDVVTWNSTPNATEAFKYMWRQGWLKKWTVYFGIDGISLWLLLLTTFLMVICAASIRFNMKHMKEALMFLIAIECLLIISFTVLDIFYFYFILNNADVFS